MMLLEKRKKALQAEGLFEQDRKRPIPYLPEFIGVVTSLQGAVIRDILHRLRERFPRKVLVWPVAVQGENCAPQVTRAIEGFNALTPGGAVPRPDLIIVARGGGSIEDLWGFNEESVARAAANSDIPLISAVGHETDPTLIDYVSDKRAPTPTAAAEMAVPVRLDLMAAVDNYESRMKTALATGLDRKGQRLRDMARALPRADDLTGRAGQRLDAVTVRLPGALRAATQSKELALQRASAPLRPTILKGQTDRLSARLDAAGARLGKALQTRADKAQAQLEKTAARLVPTRLGRDITENQQKLTRASEALSKSANRQIENWQGRVDRADRLRETLGYQATLDRGYAVVWSDKDVVTTKGQAKAGITDIQFKDGKYKLAGSKPKPTAKTPTQTSLFDD
jgi:exodeoxyribonuclease VII large subunit